MKTTTQTDFSTFANKYFLPFILLALAIVLLSNALPAAIARLIMLPHENTREELLLRNEVSEKDLVSFIESRKQALKWIQKAEIYDQISLSFLALSEKQKPNSKEEKELMKESYAWQMMSLKRAPANPFGWARLAYLSRHLQLPDKNAVYALSRSIYSGPYEPTLMLLRLIMAVQLWDSLDADLKESVPMMVWWIWENNPDELASSAVDNGFVSLVEEVLEKRPDDLSSFKEKITQIKDKS